VADVKKSLEIVVGARDEASAKFAKIEKSAQALSVSTVLKGVAAIGGIATVANAAAAGWKIATAQAQQAMTLQEGAADEMLEAQIKVNDAWAEMGASIPIIGQGIRSIMDSWNDNEGLRRTIQSIRQVRTETERAAVAAKAWRRENELRAAELRGAPESEKKAIAGGQTVEDREKQVREIRDTERQAKRNVDKALADLRERSASAAREATKANRFGMPFNYLSADWTDRARGEWNAVLAEYHKIMKAREKAESEFGQWKLDQVGLTEKRAGEEIIKAAADERKAREAELAEWLKAKIQAENEALRKARAVAGVIESIEDERLRRLGHNLELEIRMIQRRHEAWINTLRDAGAEEAEIDRARANRAAEIAAARDRDQQKRFRAEAEAAAKWFGQQQEEVDVIRRGLDAIERARAPRDASAFVSRFLERAPEAAPPPDPLDTKRNDILEQLLQAIKDAQKITVNETTLS